MFEKLDYNLFVNKKGRIMEFRKRQVDMVRSIMFDLECKTFTPKNIYDSGKAYGLNVTVDEIQAITQQMKELGWIE